MSVKPYSKYKDSETKWLGHVPTEWRIAKLGSMFIERKEKVSDKEYPPLSVTKNGILPQLESAAKTNDGDNRKKVCEGDFVINSRSDRKGSSGLSALTGSVSVISTVLQPNGYINKYSHYLLKSQPFQEEYYRVGHGIVADLWTTRFSEMRTILVTVPSSEEQKQITSYLDWKTSQINRFIKAKKRQIELLKEQKQVIINDAVTGKIDVNTGKPYPEYKDSGVEWLGKVPEEWEVLFIRQITKCVKTGSTPKNSSEKHFDDNGFTWFTPGDFSENLFLTGSSRKLSQLGCKEVSIFPKGSVLMIGIGATIGKASICTEEAACNQQINVLIPKSNLLNVYLVYILRLLKPFILKSGKFTTLPILNQDDTKKLRVPLPSLTAQRVIVNYLKGRLLNIDKLIVKIEEEIKHIIEYRTRLIAEAVTGKVDVRDIKVPEFGIGNKLEEIDITSEIEEEVEGSTVDNDS